MARPKKKQADGSVVLFDVVYEDGSRSSNRKVPFETVSGYEGDGPARAFIEAQDRKIGELSGKLVGSIKQIRRSSSR